MVVQAEYAHVSYAVGTTSDEEKREWWYSNSVTLPHQARIDTSDSWGTLNDPVDDNRAGNRARYGCRTYVDRRTKSLGRSWEILKNRLLSRWLGSVPRIKSIDWKANLIAPLLLTVTCFWDLSFTIRLDLRGTIRVKLDDCKPGLKET